MFQIKLTINLKPQTPYYITFILNLIEYPHDQQYYEKGHKVTNFTTYSYIYINITINNIHYVQKNIFFFSLKYKVIYSLRYIFL